MEPDVVVSNQYNQFCVRGVPEHPVETAHVVLPVLQRDTTQRKEQRNQSGDKRPGRKLTMSKWDLWGSPIRTRAALIHTLDFILHLQGSDVHTSPFNCI